MSCGNECHFIELGRGGNPNYALQGRGNYSPRGIITIIGYDEPAMMKNYVATSTRQMPELGSFKEYNSDYTIDKPVTHEKTSIEHASWNKNYSNLVSVLSQAEEIIEYQGKTIDETEDKKLQLEKLIENARNKWTN